MLKLTWKDVPNFAFKIHVQLFVRKATYEHGSLKKLATDISNRYLKGKDFELMVQTYLDICWTIDGIKVKTIGEAAPITRSNTLMQAIAMVYMNENPVTAEQCDQINQFAEKCKNSSVSIHNWFFPKVYTLWMYASYASQINDFARNLVVDPQIDESTLAFLYESMKGVGAEINEIVTELSMLRKYGVKSSFFQDGMLHGPDEAWVFTDFHELIPQISEWRQFMPSIPLAVVSLSNKSDLTEIGFTTKLHESGIGKMSGAGSLFTTRGFMHIDSKGELDTSPGLGLMPVREIFERHNKVAFYETLRFVHAIRLYDLVVPITTVSQMPQPLVPKGILDRLKGVLNKKHLLQLDLIIPRVRTLENVDQLIRELEDEIEKADTETMVRTKRELRRHEVIYHVRRLPKGKHPTAEARARAAEYNIVLADDETFVKPHERGEGSLVKTLHQAVVRQGK